MIQVLPALVIALIALAYIEEDGVLLSIALLTALALLAIAATVVWHMVVCAQWIISVGRPQLRPVFCGLIGRPPTSQSMIRSPDAPTTVRNSG